MRKIIWFLLILLCSCNNRSIEKKDGETHFHQIDGSSYPRITKTNNYPRQFIIDSTYFPTFEVNYFADLYLKDSLDLNDESFKTVDLFLYAKTYDIDENIPATLQEFDMDNAMDIFIPDKEQISEIPLYLEFDSVGEKKQVFILYEIIQLQKNKDSTRIIELYSTVLDTIKVVRK